ncbi:polyprenyl synthetase family protein [Actinoallomurus sp. NBC_01490]|uniref:polyprenyl synthetase family protein n=1 Tax=Actinoallomurus sp. NBC_01490 TaxID=2903557 RepID=UPI002E3102F9|nr:polyprenyl synthetase family protein [Actinoallomurus sp. NBC_01490]
MTGDLSESVQAARRVAEPVLREAVARLDPLTARVAGYHLGWNDAEGRPVSTGGKSLRLTLAVLSARAAGADPLRGATAAAAVELVHAFSLLHDDIMDDDRTRRHRPTAWVVFGRSAAILTGDALLILAMDLLLEQGTRGAVSAARCLSAATQRLIAGQAADLDFERRQDVGVEECRRMAADKTGALLACACSIGALFVEAPQPLVTALAAYGAELGMAFQLSDDLLGIWGDPRTTGKPALSDLRARKKTLPAVAALTGDTVAGRRLAELLGGSGRLSEADLREAAQLIDQAGGRAWAEKQAQHHLDASERILGGTPMPADVRAEFSDIARFITSRDH